MRSPIAVCLILAACLLPGPRQAMAQSGSPDPVFDDVHFARWSADGAGTHFNWNVSLSETLLSTHQRLFSRVVMNVGGEELARRRGQGQFLMMIQLTDEKGAVWQHHYPIDLETIAEGVKGNDYQYVQPFFVLPGDYTVLLALFDTASEEHTVTRRKLHVRQLRSDPLHGAWRNLPAVEFLEPCDPPDAWFLPMIRGKLDLPVKTKHPVQIDLLVNLTPTDRFAGSSRAQNVNMSVLIPVVKVLSAVNWGDAKLNVELLDLSRNRVVYRQDNVRDIDWGRAGFRLAQTAPGVIDVKSLANHRYSASFFVNEVKRRITAPLSPGQPRAVIVLSSTISFRPEVELHPIEAGLPRGTRIFYLRYQMPRIIAGARSGRGSGEIPVPPRLGPLTDDLEPLLKGLSPQLFDVTNAGEFRKALARIFDGVAAL
ncbi:MAG TPA: hypothetical protein VG273_15015 [Bryobacteraceae bacterium]|jgi:hypothetical protein|nr:hypothetical protein [Bryobacteraceae bacterium]